MYKHIKESDIMLDLEKQIKEWCNEYGLNPECISVEYKWINNHTLGICYFKWGAKQLGRCSIVYITDVFSNYTLASKAVLWHEFCHAELWITEDESEGHSDRWVGKLWRKPILFILDCIYTKILFAFVKHKS